MMQIEAAIEHDWRKWNIEPSQGDIASIEGVRDLATVKSILGKSNEIWIGMPIVTNIREIGQDTIDDEVLKLRLKNDNFHLVQLSIAFRPANQCDFVRASIQLTLTSNDKTSCNDNRLLVYNMFPADVYMPVTYKRVLSVNPKLDFTFSKVSQISVSAFENAESKEYVVYQPEMTSYGKGEKTFGWDFNRSSSRKIIGTKDLFFIVSSPKNCIISLQVELRDCRVQTRLGSIPLSSIWLEGSSETTHKAIYAIIDSSID